VYRCHEECKDSDGITEGGHDVEGHGMTKYKHNALAVTKLELRELRGPTTVPRLSALGFTFIQMNNLMVIMDPWWKWTGRRNGLVGEMDWWKKLMTMC